MYIEAITFANIQEQVVNNRYLSRKEKNLAIQKFIKENSGKGKQVTSEEETILETLKTLRKNYTQMDKDEKLKELMDKKSSY